MLNWNSIKHIFNFIFLDRYFRLEEDDIKNFKITLMKNDRLMRYSIIVLLGRDRVCFGVCVRTCVFMHCLIKVCLETNNLI
jgi:hypothetical protein